METDREIRLGDWGQGLVESGIKDPEETSPDGSEDPECGRAKVDFKALVSQAGGMTDAQRLAHLRMTEVLPIKTHSQSWECGGVTASQSAELRANIEVLWKQGSSGYEIAKRLGCTKYMAYQHIAKLVAK